MTIYVVIQFEGINQLHYQSLVYVCYNSSSSIFKMLIVFVLIGKCYYFFEFLINFYVLKLSFLF